MVRWLKLFLFLTIVFYCPIVSAIENDEIIEKATSCMEEIANDDSHGYHPASEHHEGIDQDYSCSTLNIHCWEEAGVPVYTKGARNANSGFKKVYLANGFDNIIDEVNIDTGEGLKRGDVLVRLGAHVAQYIGDNKIVEAAEDLDGQPGDSSHQEIHITAYRPNANPSGKWNYVFRYRGSVNAVDEKGSVADYYETFPLLDTSEDFTCETIFINNDGTDKEFKKIIQGIFTIIKIIAPAITIILTILDYIKAATNPTSMSKVNKRLFKRIAIMALILFIPYLLELLFQAFGLYSLGTCEIR